MSKPRRTPAFTIYLLPVLSWVYVLLFRRKDRLAVYHAKQAIVLALVAVGVPVVWAVVAWIAVWIPLVGSVIAAALFALVIVAYIALAVSWAIGIAYALQAKMKPVPVVGRWAERFPAGG